MTTPAQPAKMVWGVATAAYQIEGAATADGKGPSIWDTFTHMPGKIERSETGDIACDHYQRWESDVALLAQLGLTAYRFSIAWTRVLPEGRGRVNQFGLDFYDRLVDALLERDIAPFITLYHWDLPQALQDQGGWLNRDTARFFQDYADVVTARLGDRVKYWMTLNEPYIATFNGYVEGSHAPGFRVGANYFPATHHMLLGHGLALEAIRANAPGAQVGIAYSLAEIQPATDHDEDIAAAELGDAYQNGAYLDATLRGRYPATLEPHFPDDLVQPDDLTIISRPTDFIGVNYYMRLLARARRAPDFPGFVIVDWHTKERTEMNWEVYPQGLGYWLRRLANDFPDHDLYVTENGAAYHDVVGPGNTVNDSQRIAFLREHIGAALAERDKGARLRGYFVWSFLDNFEWAFGFRPRFGIVYVDYATQARYIKASGHWYAHLAATGQLDAS